MEVATKDDIRGLEARFDRLEEVLGDQLKTNTVTTVGAMTALTAIFGMMLNVFR